MGKAIEEIALKKGHDVTLRVDSASRSLLTAEELSKADVAIEFTTPHAAKENLLLCFQAGVPVVCGSTGWTSELPSIEKLCQEQKAALLYASNFSVGVNLFFELNKKLASLMAHQPSYEVILEEIHHTQKKDAPSGTAITLAQQILQQIDRKKQWVNDISENPEDLEIISQRIDPAPGTHHVKYSSVIDDIEIIHTAHSRKGFAAGAVLAAEFLQRKKGVYSMKDVLGL